MIKVLIQRFLLIRRKQSNVRGFTLLELLVSIIIASIIISTLLGFLVNILERDRVEQAKTESQEEIQSALNFIADDMSDAVHIYDADGLYRVGADDGLTVASQLPHNQPNKGICGEDLAGAGTGLATSRCTPVLVFWKRFRYDKDEDIDHDNDRRTTEISVSSLENTPAVPIGGDKYVYSLVVYYLMKGSTTDTNWSNSSRIIRWEGKSGLPYGCPTDPNCPTRLTVGNILDPNRSDTKEYAVLPSPGFDRFSLSPQVNVVDSFNQWRKNRDFRYDLKTTPYDTLIDFVDDTPYSATQDDGSRNPPAGARVNIDITKNTIPDFTATPIVLSRNPSCDDPNRGVGSGLTADQLTDPFRTVFAQRVPPDFAIVDSNRSQLSGFFACVNTSRVSARVFIRGNALARLRDNPRDRSVSDGVFEGFLPTANVRVFGRGSLNNAL
jgi:prepilin-type N-terminal cleavage/methylation domain-containing protein